MKNLKNLSRRFALLLAVCLLLVPLCASGVSAENPLDLSALCSITFNISEHPELFDAEGNPLVVADLYRVADAVPVENANAFAFQFCEPYSYCDLPNPGDAGVNAETFAQMATQATLDSGAQPDETVEGGQKAGDLAAGLYLVLIHAPNVHIEEYIANVGGKLVTAVTTATDGNMTRQLLFKPVLVTVPSKPMDDPDGTVNTASPGEWIYDQTFTPKPETNEYSEKNLILHKVDEYGNKLPNAKFKLYATRLAEYVDTIADINGGDTVTNETLIVYTEEYGYITLYCVGEYTTDKNGDIIIPPEVMDDDILYAWVETEAPAGYDLDPTPHFFFAYQAEGVGNSERYPDTVYFDAAHPDAAGDVQVTRVIKRFRGMWVNVLTFKNVSEEPVAIKVQGYGCEGVSFSFSDVDDEDDYAWDINWEEGYSVLDSLAAGASTTLYMRIDLEEMPEDSEENYHTDYGLLRATFTYECFKAGEALGATDAKAYSVETYSYAQNDAEVGIIAVNRKSVLEPDGTELPETGGMGTTAFFLAGSGLAAIALFLLAIKKRGEA